MKMRGVRALLLMAAFLVSGVAGCKGGSAGISPELYLTATGAVDSATDRIYNGENRNFLEGGGTMTLVFGNMGDDELRISNIELVTLNTDMAITEDIASLTWPIVVQPGDYREAHETVFKLHVVYTPDADRDVSETRIRVTTNDGLYTGGVFEFTVTPNEKTAEIKVTPNNYIFIGATSMNPDSVSFLVENVGDADLALAALRFNPESTAYSITYTSRNIHENVMIEPTNSAMDNGPIEVVVQYRPVTPPDLSSLEILWGSMLNTGVECNNTPTCQNNTKLCPDSTKTCPYTCFNSMCGCMFTQECRAYFCDDPDSPDCNYRCLTGVCRVPEITSVPLRGEAQAGTLEITYGDQADGCVNFEEVTDPGTSCTKILSLANAGPGSVIVTRPSIVLASEVNNPYTVEWFKLGASKDGECGNVTGEQITESKYTLTPENSPITVAVTYVAPDADGVNGDLKIPFANPYDGEQTIRLCGGSRKGELAVAPNPAKIRMTLYAAPETTAEKSVVVMNKGNLALDFTGVSVEPANVDDPQAFSIVEGNPGSFTLGEGEIRRFTVSFDGTHDGGTTVNGFINVNYIDPLLSTEINQKINVAGFNSFEGVTLPTADVGDISSYEPVKVGDSVVLDGSGSEPGTYDIPANSGYIWFVSKKPAASRVFLNSSAAQAQVTVIPDVAGEYEFRLIVYAVDSDSGQAYFSSEDVLSMTVYE